MLSIIIPCYNEGKKLEENIKQVHQYMEGIEYEIICVNDGSTDDTWEYLKNINGIIPIGYEKNRGKGYAVKFGIERASGEKILFMDADLSTGLEAINLAMKSNADIVIASRTKKDSNVEGKTFIRNISSYISNLIVRIIIGIPYRDTQCGFKMLKSDVANLLISKQTVDRWAFDVEWLYIAKLNNMTVDEIPVNWKNDRDSRVKLISGSIGFLKETINIKHNKHLYYNNN